MKPTARTPAVIIATTTLTLLTAACGGHPAAANAGAANAGSTASPVSAGTQAVAFSNCVRSNGVPNFPDPGSGGQLPKETARQLGVSDSRYQAATSACQHLLPNGGGGPTAAEVRQEWNGMLSFARCMRSHGVPNWPDPTPYPQNPQRPTFIVPASIQPVPAVISKMYACQRLVPHNFVGGHIDNDNWQSVSLAMATGS